MSPQLYVQGTESIRHDAPHNPKNRKVTVQPNSNNDSLQVEDVANVGIVKTHSV